LKTSVMTVATLIAVIVSEPDEKGEVFPLLAAIKFEEGEVTTMTTLLSSSIALAVALFALIISGSAWGGLTGCLQGFTCRIHWRWQP